MEKRIINTAKINKAVNIEVNRGITRKEDSYNYEDIEEELEKLVKLVQAAEVLVEKTAEI